MRDLFTFCFIKSSNIELQEVDERSIENFVDERSVENNVRYFLSSGRHNDHWNMYKFANLSFALIMVSLAHHLLLNCNHNRFSNCVNF